MLQGRQVRLGQLQPTQLMGLPAQGSATLGLWQSPSSIHAHICVPLGTWRCLATCLAHHVSAQPPCTWLLNPKAIVRLHPADGLLTTSGWAASLYLCTLLAGQWAPYLARLHNTGSINAWSTDRSNAWIQVKGALWLKALLRALQGHAHG